MKIIDSHMHVNLKGQTADKIIASMNQNGIDKCWLLTWEQMMPPLPHLYTALMVDDVWEAYEKYPSRFIPMYAPDPSRANAIDDLKKWHKKGIRGCGELKVDLDWNSEEIGKLLDCINELGLPLVFHMEEAREIYDVTDDSFINRTLGKVFSSEKLPNFWSSITKGISNIIPAVGKNIEANRKYFKGYLTDFNSFEKRLQRYAGINFIGHGPFFWKSIARNTKHPNIVYPKGRVRQEGKSVELLEKHDNLYADISGFSGYNAIYRDRVYAKKFLERFSNKILYGTDNIDYNLKDLILSLKLGKSSLKSIFYDNADRLLANI